MRAKEARRAPLGESCEAEVGLGGACVGKQGKKGPAGRECGSKKVRKVERPQDVMEFVVDVGETMLRYGGEIYRVEDTVRRILGVYNANQASVYVLSNGIFVSIRNTDGQSHSLVRQVTLGAINLRGIAELNQLSRDVVAGEYTLFDARQRLKEIEDLPDERSAILCLSCGLGCGMYSLLLCMGEWFNNNASTSKPAELREILQGINLGGRVLLCQSKILFNFSAAFLIGALLELAMLWMGKRNMTRLVRSLFGSMLVTVSCLGLILLGLPISQDNVIISATLPLFPGIAFTTSIRDFFNGDHLSGVIHLVDALLTALCIAAGVGVVIMLTQTLR